MGVPHIEAYPARTKRPLTAYPIIGAGGPRVIPGGALVTIVENHAPVTEHRDPGVTAWTATVYLDGTPYECEVQPEQFTRHQPETIQENGTD